jgi:hypothetical protein
MDNFEALQRSNQELENEMLIAAQEKRARLRSAVARAAKESRVRPLDSTIEFPDALLVAIEKLPNVRLATSVGGGQLAGKDLQSGENLSAVQLVERALLANADLKDGRSVSHLDSPHNAQELIKCRADLRTDTEKMQYISKYGLPAWQNLPLTRQQRLPQSDPELMTKSEYLKMTVPQKVAFQDLLVEKYGSGWEQAKGAILQRT